MSVPEDGDLPPWLQRPPDDDHSDIAEWRRDVLDLLLEVQADSRPRLEPTPASPDVRAGTPFRLVRAVRALEHGLGRAADGRSRRVGRRELLLIEVGRASRISPGRLARNLGLRPATVTAGIRVAERDGLVLSRPDLDDRRRRLLELTPEGRRVAGEAAAAWRAADERLLKWMSAAERDELRRLLRKAAAALDRGPRRR